MSKHLVIIPTYNEKENASKIIHAVLNLSEPFDVLIVDDGSPDGTGQIVKQEMESNPGRVHLIERTGKLGLGTAYITGFKWGLDNDYDFIYEMDADFSHNPKDLLRLRRVVVEDRGDVAVGSRYVKGGKLKDWPYDRILLSYGASLYVRILTWMPVMDPTAGFVCYKREVLEKINLDKIRFVGYAFQIEMKFTAHQLGYHIREIPITFADRTEGSSKMSSGIIKEAIFGVLQMRFGSLFGKRDATS